MSQHFQTSPAFLSFADAERSPLSIRARALVFFDPRSKRLLHQLEELAATSFAVLIQGDMEGEVFVQSDYLLLIGLTILGIGSMFLLYKQTEQKTV